MTTTTIQVGQKPRKECGEGTFSILPCPPFGAPPLLPPPPSLSLAGLPGEGGLGLVGWRSPQGSKRGRRGRGVRRSGASKPGIYLDGWEHGEMAFFLFFCLFGRADDDDDGRTPLSPFPPFRSGGTIDFVALL